MSSNEGSSGHPDLVNTGQPWIAEVIDQQEEHLSRIRPCTGGRCPNPQPGMEHAWGPSLTPARRHRPAVLALRRHRDRRGLPAEDRGREA